MTSRAHTILLTDGSLVGPINPLPVTGAAGGAAPGATSASPSYGVTVQRATLAEGGGATSATVNAATQVLPADPNRRKFEFQNTGTALITLRINQGADTTVAAAGSATKRMIAVPAGQLYVTEPDWAPTGLVSVASATASVPFSYLAS